MARIVDLVESVRASVMGERRHVRRRGPTDDVTGVLWLALTVAAFFLIAAYLTGPPD